VGRARPGPRWPISCCAAPRVRRPARGSRPTRPAGRRPRAGRLRGAGVDVAQHVAPERRQRPRVVGVEGDLDVAAHRVAPFVAGRGGPTTRRRTGIARWMSQPYGFASTDRAATRAPHPRLPRGRQSVRQPASSRRPQVSPKVPIEGSTHRDRSADLAPRSGFVRARVASVAVRRNHALPLNVEPPSRDGTERGP
jgi:hypothetical protein